ncbi:hypothetical protein AB0B71_27045 [Micromonospora echinofusca]|uniref:hypothetical protein n=1 Tax=Micromonospora echinofusca TaxID=47858 RepID=UPI00340C6043
MRLDRHQGKPVLSLPQLDPCDGNALAVFVKLGVVDVEDGGTPIRSGPVDRARSCAPSCWGFLVIAPSGGVFVLPVISSAGDL